MSKISFYDQIAKNRRQSILLAFFVFLILLALVYVIAEIFAPGYSLLFVGFSSIFIGIYILMTYRYGDKVILTATNAKLATGDEYVFLRNTVEGLSLAAGIPAPEIYVIESEEMNAFATGRDPENASVTVTTGLLKNLKRDEIEGVIGHELSHIRNYDIRFATLVAVMVGLVAILSHLLLRSYGWGIRSRRRSKSRGRDGGGLFLAVGFVLAIFAPIIVRIVQFAVSRSREYLADASSVELTRYPEGLASALEKIMKTNEGKMNVSEAVSHLFFVDPNKSALDAVYATHPPIEQRVKILRSM
jgi:heat shock protein HtpX